MDDEERIEFLLAALKRIAEPEAFYVATSDVDPEVFARMAYARNILDDFTLERAEEKAKFDTRARYPLRRHQ